MVGNQRLELKQSQQMVMTQQMQQSIHILQLSTLELQNYLTEELEKNPLLTTEDTSSELQNDESPDLNIKEEHTTPTELTSASDNQDVLHDAADSNIEFENTYHNETKESPDYATHDSHYSNASSGGSDENTWDIEQLSDKDLTLKEHLIEQIHVDITGSQQKIIALHLTDLLDDNGYLPEDYQTLPDKLQCSTEDIDLVLAKIQQFDPPGVYARSLAECLGLQLKHKDHCDPAMQALLDNLDMLAKQEFAKLKKICGVDQEDLMDMIHEIHTLNPKPGSNFNPEVTINAEPDVFVHKKPEGGWMVELNTDALPKMLVNQTYYGDISKSVHNKKEKKYLNQQLNTANWLIKALDQRAHTILKVATELVIQQEAFFEQGIRYLKPMTLKSIAEAIEMHESTVSRVTHNKYIATPYGLYEMRYFFSSTVGSHGNNEEGFSSTSIKHMIKELINNEAPNKILSDDKIAELLKAQGIDIARRTVAKYREAMKIPTSSQRKRTKRPM